MNAEMPMQLTFPNMGLPEEVPNGAPRHERTTTLAVAGSANLHQIEQAFGVQMQLQCFNECFNGGHAAVAGAVFDRSTAELCRGVIRIDREGFRMTLPIDRRQHAHGQARSDLREVERQIR